jgi:hypothetical protein
MIPAVLAGVAALVEVIADCAVPRSPSQQLVEVIGRIAALEARLPFLPHGGPRYRASTIRLARLRAQARALRDLIDAGAA